MADMAFPVPARAARSAEPRMFGRSARASAARRPCSARVGLWANAATATTITWDAAHSGNWALSNGGRTATSPNTGRDSDPVWFPVLLLLEWLLIVLPQLDTHRARPVPVQPLLGFGKRFRPGTFASRLTFFPARRNAGVAQLDEADDSSGRHAGIGPTPRPVRAGACVCQEEIKSLCGFNVSDLPPPKNKTKGAKHSEAVPVSRPSRLRAN